MKLNENLLKFKEFSKFKLNENAQFSSDLEDYLHKISEIDDLTDWKCELVNTNQTNLDKDDDTSFIGTLISLKVNFPKEGFCRFYLNDKMDYVFALEIIDSNIIPKNIPGIWKVHVFEIKNSNFSKDETKIKFKIDYNYRKTIQWDSLIKCIELANTQNMFFSKIRSIISKE